MWLTFGLNPLFNSNKTNNLNKIKDLIIPGTGDQRCILCLESGKRRFKRGRDTIETESKGTT
jgi:hypothetical protein